MQRAAWEEVHAPYFSVILVQILPSNAHVPKSAAPCRDSSLGSFRSQPAAFGHLLGAVENTDAWVPLLQDSDTGHLGLAWAVGDLKDPHEGLG